MYADLKDVNTHLPQDKLPMDSSELPLKALDADRIIRGYVGGVIPITTIAAWADPASTPEMIRAIAGRLIAAAYYSERYAENSPDESRYAQKLYNQAIAQLMGIAAGTVLIIDPDGSTIETTSAGLDKAMFSPNDGTAPGPAFTRGQIFG
jgi:hypothetical protein